MVGMVTTLAILDFHSLGVASVIMTRFVVLVVIAVSVVLAWRIGKHLDDASHKANNRIGLCCVGLDG